jgi:glycosyltransferase involved in cell wall biosynthesis
MKVLIRQFLGKNHSWSCFGWGIATALINQGHEVHLFSTDGIAHLPNHLKENLIGYVEENSLKLAGGKMPDNNYNCQISYTCMKNFSHYLSNGTTNRFGIWVYEWQGHNILPYGFAKHYRSCDYLCVPSNFGKEVFINSGIPASAIKVIPHGINVEEYKQTTTIELPTNKKCKILANIAQNHLRKNIPGLLEAYGRAFVNTDDVCLILKAKDKSIVAPFEVSLSGCLKTFKQKYPKHAEVKVLSSFIDDISALYRSVDIVYTMAHCEGFYFPGLEGIASGKLSIAPNWGGQLDFLNDQNALLVDGKEVRADPKSMYWENKNNAIWFQPSIEDAANKLQYAYQNYEKLNQRVDVARLDVYSKYNWKTITSQFIELCR